jgi:site-specific DNA recombinase
MQPVHSHRDAPCPAREIPAAQLDELIWQDLCEVLRPPALLCAALTRAQGGDWLPQALQARREHLRKARASISQHLDRLTDAYWHASIPLEEDERRRREREQTAQALVSQEQHLASETDWHREVTGRASSIEAFCQRVRSGLTNATFERKRQLGMVLIDRVMVTDSDVEIRYVVPPSPASEHVRFCHLRKDYFDHPAPRQDHKPFPVIAPQHGL